MEANLAKVRQVLGDQDYIAESEIRETLWYYYFDIEQTVSWLLSTFNLPEHFLTCVDKYAGTKQAKMGNTKTGEPSAKPKSAKGKPPPSFSQAPCIPFGFPKEDLTLAVSREAQQFVEPLKDLKVVVCSSNFGDLVIRGN
jgi:hypothetical protein